MSAALDKLLRCSTFFYRCRGVDVVGGVPYMVDSGPHRLHAAMVNFTAPAYGVVTMPSGRPAIQFDGTTQYATLPLRFYDDAPTTELTFVAQIRHESPVTNDYLFYATSAAAKGSRWRYYTVASPDGRMTIDWYGAAATLSLAYETTNRGMIPRVQTMIHGMNVVSLGQLSLSDRLRTITAFAVAGGGPVVWDPAEVPIIMGRVGVSYTGGTLLTLGLFPWLFTDAEAKYMTDLLTAGAV